MNNSFCLSHNAASFILIELRSRSRPDDMKAKEWLEGSYLEGLLSAV